ncbi:MAG: hypothetical protein O2877_02710, partial [bacterium]|nr:hypothetical protein [bacterium]
MSTDIPSIEDLLKKPAAPNGKTGKPAGKLESEKTAPEKFEERMVEIKLKEKETLAVKQAAASHTAYMELRGFAISPEALALIPFETAKETGALAFLYTGPELRIAA